MECPVINCKCTCHILSPQEPNIKELLIQELEKEIAAENIPNESHVLEKVTETYFDEQNELWQRRLRIHKGQEAPLSFNEYKDNFPKLDDVKKIYGVEDPRDQVPTTNAQPAASDNIQPKRTDNLQDYKVTDHTIIDPTDVFPTNAPKPVPINPLHKYKVKERDRIIRDIYGRALSEMRKRYPMLDTQSQEFNELVNKEADRLLDIWLQANK
jgi:hypothetical protein